MEIPSRVTASAGPRIGTLIAPALASGVLVLWTAAVYSFSGYGDAWAIWPALAVLPIVAIWHAVLVFRLQGFRKAALLAAGGHLLFLVPLWFVCLMLISKDSL